jgi:hypothetical protein
MNITRNFFRGRMNKSVDERLVPNGEYIDALNIRLGSSEKSDVGSIESTKGNVSLTTLSYDGTELSDNARTIGAYEDGANERLYWFVHDPTFALGATGKLDMVVSYDVRNDVLIYHIVSIDDGGGVNTTLNFNPQYLITGVDLVDSADEGLLFWTDDYNQPRFINIQRNYPNPNASYIDQFTDESILVVKRPPSQSPDIQLIQTNNQENFMEERFICFAYRYRYEDGEYSATSQFTEPSFLPSAFFFDDESYLNEGMINSFNACEIEYNSGGPLVKKIELLFKEADSNVIKVIERLDKSELGIPDNSTETYTFNNSKIFTVLSDSEILRLYDNVPRRAKAQTIMQNRLVYGNYVDGYDLVDYNGDKLRLDYIVDLESEIIDFQSISAYTEPASYGIDPATSVAVPDSRIVLDLTNVASNLKSGSQLSFAITVNHYSFSGGSPSPTGVTANVDINFAFTLPTDYPDVWSLATSQEFKDAIGTSLPSGTIKPVYHPTDPTSCDGYTFTDEFNCSIPQNLSGSITVEKYESGITNIGDGSGDFIIPSVPPPSNDLIKIVIPAMKFVDDVTAPTFEVYEYYQITSIDASFVASSANKSLHSNRNYELGIVYMDEYGRSSTALVSENNTIHVPCSGCDKQNKAIVTIPTSQRAPYWASRYKFVAKADRDGYETIYSNIFVKDPETGSVFLYLQGENSRKVEEGDRLLVKADSNGPLSYCSDVTVLEKQAKAANFVGTSVPSPSGVYMKLNPSSISIVPDPNSYVTAGTLSAIAASNNQYPVVNYPFGYLSGSSYVDYDIPSGSIVRVEFRFTRKGTGDGNNNCERRNYTFINQYTASASYANFKDFFDAQNLGSTLNDGVEEIGGTGNCGAFNQYYPALDTSSWTTGPSSGDVCINKYKFVRDPSNNKLYLSVIGTRACGASSKKQSALSIKIEIFRSGSTIIFETEPSDTLPDIFFENDMSFEIGPDGQHYGNLQDQDFGTNTPAIVDTRFFNCYVFGNGAESYKVRDSVVGKTFNLGNRVTSVSEVDYMEADRYSDLTYSGVYNDETNINKLNEFNLGLLNFKPLEDSFGEISLIDGRETDILVLQEDKISYVLAGKNILTDSTGGSAITSVPEVLGTQIARIEEYGNSFNPESFAKWGQYKFFTDSKRGAILMLSGIGQSESLSVISDLGMRSWFRDMFIEGASTQKLGGYDPYMNEYVLSNNTISLPEDDDCDDCGNERTKFSLGTKFGNDVYSFCSDLGILIGDVVVEWNIPALTAGAYIVIEAVYDGVTYSSGPVGVAGSFTIPKTAASPTTVDVTAQIFIGSSPTAAVATLDLTVNCPASNEINVVEVVITDDADSGKYIHSEYKYTSGSYISPVSSNLVTFQSGSSNPLVSRYNVTTGYQGSGSIPVNGSTVTMISNKISFDNFDFNPSTNKFKWLRSSTLYNNNVSDISTLLSLAATATPIVGAMPTYYADFTMPSTSDDYLYLVWDLRTPTEAELCYSDVSVDDACCGCDNCVELCSQYEIISSGSGAVIEYTDCETGDVITTSAPEGTTNVCSRTIPIVIAGEINVNFVQCGCPTRG